MKKTACAIIVNGGAGGLNFPERRRNGLVKAVSIGYSILKQGGSSLDAVERASMILEDATVFNAGTGSYLNLVGEVEMDASVMTSEMTFGAVAAVKNVRHPISVARLVMEKTDHLLLCGKGATKFARIMGIKPYNPETKEKRRLWQRKKRNLKHSYFPKLKEIADSYGTIGVVAIDKKGLLSAANSTGGISLNMPGRVGDTPVIGGGVYADKHGGVTATGHGEEIMRHLLSFRAVCFMSSHRARIAGKMAIDYATKYGCRCGVIGLDKKGGILCVNNTRAMSWCYIKNGRMRVFKY